MNLLKVLKDERGFLDPMTMSTLVSVGAQVAGGLLNRKKKDPKPEIITKQLPDYAEADRARGGLSEKLDAFGQMGGYGAIAPDWADIWSLATNKVRDYFGGTATMPGARARSRASAAARGVSDSPALEAGLDRLSAEEGRMISDLALNESVNKAQFAEQGRRSWMGDMFNLAGMKPTYASTVYQPPQKAGIGDLVSSVGGMVGQGLMQKGQQDWLGKMLGKSG